MRTDNTTVILNNILIASGINPLRLKAHLEQSLQVEYAVLYANRNKIPDDQYMEFKLTMIETEILIIMLSEV